MELCSTRSSYFTRAIISLISLVFRPFFLLYIYPWNLYLYVFFSTLDISLQENVGFEESVENLNLLKEFCENNFNQKLFCFNFEDFLYGPLLMKINKLAFIAELFNWLEVQPFSTTIKANHFDQFKDYIKSKV